MKITSEIIEFDFPIYREGNTSKSEQKNETSPLIKDEDTVPKRSAHLFKIENTSNKNREKNKNAKKFICSKENENNSGKVILNCGDKKNNQNEENKSNLIKKNSEKEEKCDSKIEKRLEPTNAPLDDVNNNVDQKGINEGIPMIKDKNKTCEKINENINRDKDVENSNKNKNNYPFYKLENENSKFIYINKK